MRINRRKGKGVMLVSRPKGRGARGRELPFICGEDGEDGPFDGPAHVLRAASLLSKRSRGAGRVASAAVVKENLQPLPPRSEKVVAGVSESAPALALQEPDVSSLEESLDTTSSEESITASDNSTDGSPPSTSSLGSKILIRRPPNWYQTYFIRMNLPGSFCMYPDLGGPFKSLDEAEGAINDHLSELKRPATCKEQGEMSLVDWLVYECMHYADSTPKRGPNSQKRKCTECEEHYLVQALLDKYNDDHNLFGDVAYELESLLRHEWIYENDRWFYHFNVTAKTKDTNCAPSSGKMFFAETSHMQGEDAWEVSCCCIIDSKDDGLTHGPWIRIADLPGLDSDQHTIAIELKGHCNGCRNNGSPDMRHPSDTRAYTGGHLDGYLPFGDDELSEESDDEETEEERLRYIYKGLDDPVALEKLYSYFD